MYVQQAEKRRHFYLVSVLASMQPAHQETNHFRINCGQLGGRLGSSIFVYETQKVVSISSLKIGLIYRFIQMNIVLYIILYVLVYQKRYQTFDNVVSGVTTKLKGELFI